MSIIASIDSGDIIQIITIYFVSAIPQVFAWPSWESAGAIFGPSTVSIGGGWGRRLHTTDCRVAWRGLDARIVLLCGALV
jgi:hypothetical protein